MESLQDVSERCVMTACCVLYRKAGHRAVSYHGVTETVYRIQYWRTRNEINWYVISKCPFSVRFVSGSLRLCVETYPAYVLRVTYYALCITRYVLCLTQYGTIHRTDMHLVQKGGHV